MAQYLAFFFSPRKNLFFILFWRVCASTRMLGAGFFSFLLANGGNSGAPALGYWLACWGFPLSSIPT